VKILDFGLAKLTQAKDSSDVDPTLTEATEPGVVMGTVGYMSPEQVRGQAADARSDIFAFGAILYEMVTGKPTFRKPTPAETMTAILNEDPPSLSQLAPSVPPGLQRVAHRCLEKNPEQRFHSAHDLAFALEALTDPAIPSPSGGYGQESTKPNRRRIAIVGVLFVVVLGAAALAYFWTRPEPVPVVSNYVQLTRDGQQKNLVGTDGSRLYLAFRGYSGIGEMSVSGGAPNRIPAPSPAMIPVGLSPDGSELLVVDGQGGVPAKGPLWSLPVLGGSPRRLGDTVGQDAAWSQDGKMLAYLNGSDLFLAKADGSESRKLVTAKSANTVQHIVWSPHGSHLRFDVWEGIVGPVSPWEVSVDGANLHRLLPGWRNPPDECCGRWTADGKYFVFQSRGQIWAQPLNGGLLHSEAKPIQLTSSPLSLSAPLPSKDGKKLFVVGRTNRGELMRYNRKSGEFSSFLGGLSAEYADFSKDGQWVAYVSYPEGTLWRSKVDGSERLQLTYPPNYAMLPRWSPDGKKIVFTEDISGKPARITEISADGGSSRQLMPDDPNPQWDPTWSPDGSKIVFGGLVRDPASTIRVLDLASHQVSTLPESQGLFSPHWSPDGRYIAALSADSTRLLLFEVQTQKWTELSKASLGFPNWSKDGQYVYAGITVGMGGAVVRIGISDHRSEQVVDDKSIKSIRPAGRYGFSFALAPDDSPLMLRDTGTQDVYSLDWEEP
jgi:Tol biopolymer transport system component